MKNNRLELKPCFRFTKMGSAWNYNWNDGFASEGETHISWEIVYVASGCVRVTEDAKLYDLREGEMIVHAPMEFHTIRSAYGTSPNVYIVCVVAEGELPQNITEGVFCLSEKERQEYKALFERIYSFFHSIEKEPFSGQECVDSLSSFLIRMSFNHTAEEKLMLSHSAMEYNKIVTSMTEHVYDNCTLEDFAVFNNTSVSNMKVLFRKYCGISPKMYYARLRCSEAIRLMAGGLSAIEASDRLSFSSPSYFNTFFKRMTGKPPLTFIKTPHM